MTRSQPVNPSSQSRVRRTILLDAGCRAIVLLAMLLLTWDLSTTSDLFIDTRPLAIAVAGWQATALLVEGRVMRSISLGRGASTTALASVTGLALLRFSILLATLLGRPAHTPVASTAIAVVVAIGTVVVLASAISAWIGLHPSA